MTSDSDLRDELMEARASLQDQIEKLQFRPNPPNKSTGHRPE